MTSTFGREAVKKWIGTSLGRGSYKVKWKRDTPSVFLPVAKNTNRFSWAALVQDQDGKEEWTR